MQAQVALIETENKNIFMEGDTEKRMKNEEGRRKKTQKKERDKNLQKEMCKLTPKQRAELLNKADLYNTKEIDLFIMGEKWVKDQKEEDYLKEGIVPLEAIGKIKGSCFCHRNIVEDNWLITVPVDHFVNSAVVLGAVLPPSKI